MDSLNLGWLIYIVKYCVLNSTRFEFLVIEEWNERNFAILKDVFAKNVNDITKILRDVFSLHKNYSQTIKEKS